MRVGITGGIACGKSTVLSHVASLGYSVFSSDEAFKEIFNLQTTQDWLIERLSKIYSAKEVEDFKQTGKTLIKYAMLSNPQFKKDYEAFVHPQIRQRMIDFNPDVAEVPLMFEAGAQYLFEHVWVVACQPETQVQRLMSRLQCDRDYALAWINQQMPLSEKIAMADRVIYTDQPLAQVLNDVELALKSVF